MNNTETRQNIKAVYLFAVIMMCIFYGLYFITVPIWNGMRVNVSYRETLVLNIVYFFLKTLDVCGIAVSYAITVFLIYKKGKAAYGETFLISGVSLFLKCFIVQIILWIQGGGIPSFNNGFLEESLWRIVIPFAIEIIQFVVFFFIAKGAIIRYRESYIRNTLKSGKKGLDYLNMDHKVYPFERPIDCKNPLLRGCFVGGMTMCISKVISTIPAEIDMRLSGIKVDAIFVIDTVSTYLFYLACGVLSYALMVFVIIKAFELASKKAAK